MHELFFDWYRLVKIDVKEEELIKRWKGIEAFFEKRDPNSELEIVRLYYGKPPKDPGFLEGYQKIFKQQDETFPMRENDLMVKVLAGTSIVFCLQNVKELADKVALATVCPDYQGLFRENPLLDIVEIARKHIEAQSLQNRSRHVLPQITIPDISGNIPPEKLSSVIVNIMTYTNNTISELNTYLEIEREESNVLWWLFAEYSNDLNRRMAELDPSVASLVAGKELADLTCISPGLFSAEAFLDKIVNAVAKKTHNTSLKQAVNNAPTEWKKKWIQERNPKMIEDLCPVHYAITKSIEFQDLESWVPVFDKNTAIKADQKITLTKLALQVYQENLFIKPAS
jgi:hypothetical protein